MATTRVALKRFAVSSRAAELFHTYDQDCSGTIDAEEMLKILRVLDPAVQMEDVHDSFRMAGVTTTTMDQQQFWMW